MACVPTDLALACCEGHSDHLMNMSTPCAVLSVLLPQVSRSSSQWLLMTSGYLSQALLCLKCTLGIQMDCQFLVRNLHVRFQLLSSSDPLQNGHQLRPNSDRPVPAHTQHHFDHSLSRQLCYFPLIHFPYYRIC